MEYKLDLLQKRVNHLEDLILSINDKIGVVLDEFFTHRAKQAADIRQKSLDEENLCLSLMSKFKSCFEVPERERRDSTSTSANANSTTDSRVPNPLLTSLLRAPPQLNSETEVPATTPVVSVNVPSTASSSTNVTLARRIGPRRVSKRSTPASIANGVPVNERVVQEEQQEQEQEQETQPIIVGNVFGNYSDPDRGEPVAGTNSEDSNDDEGNTYEDPLFPDTADDAAEKGPDTPAPPVDDEMLSLLCDPEVYIKTENTIYTDANMDTYGENNQSLLTGPAAPEAPELPDPEENEQPSDGGLRTPNSKSNYRRARAFKSLDDGKIYMKMNSMITRSANDLATARHYYYRCKDKKCPKLMYLAKSYSNGRIVLYDKAVEHNHLPFPVEMPTPRTGSSNNKSTFTSVPTFKLIQTFMNRAEAMAKIQAQEPGAWILNQVVECPDSVKAYYNCGLHSGGGCPKSMVLRTFNENGKVDHYIWQGDHVVASEGNDHEFADYFTPPSTVTCKTGRHAGRSFTCIRSFATEEEARAEAAADTSAIWDLKSTHHTINGKKLYFGCKHRKCPMTMYLQMVTLAGKAFQYLSSGEHDHTRGHEREKKPKKMKPGKGKGNPHAKEWATVANFASEAEGREHIRNELAWAFRNSFRSSNGGKKMYYLCKHDVKCPVRCALIINGETGAAAMCITTKEAHVHNSAPRPKLGRGGKKIKLAPELRGVIDQLYAAGFRTVEKILKELEARGTPAPPYHVFGYLTRLRRMKYGRGRGGRRPKVPVPNPSRVLSGNPKNEQRRRALHAAAEAKRAANVGTSSSSSYLHLDHFTATTAASALIVSPRRMRLSMVGDSPEERQEKERIRQLCLNSKAFVHVKRLDLL